MIRNIPGIMIIPKEKQEILDNVVSELKSIHNLEAIVLGGSYATGMATDSSDLDIGIYYYGDRPFDIESIRAIAKRYAKDGNPTVTGFYEWGPWVNGGAWIHTVVGKVDFLYKNINQIRVTIEKAQIGEWENHFEQQPPFGFSSIILLGETMHCIPLYDPGGIISELKSQVQIYPPKLKETVIQYSLWSAEFTIWHAEYFSKKNEFYNTMGCMTRGVKSIVTALFAINELYPMGDKRAITILDKSVKIPPNLDQKIESILSAETKTTNNNIARLKSLFQETVNLAEGKYKPFYNLGES